MWAQILQYPPTSVMAIIYRQEPTEEDSLVWERQGKTAILTHKWNSKLTKEQNQIVKKKKITV